MLSKGVLDGKMSSSSEFHSRGPLLPLGYLTLGSVPSYPGAMDLDLLWNSQRRWVSSGRFDRFVTYREAIVNRVAFLVLVKVTATGPE